MKFGNFPVPQNRLLAGLMLALAGAGAVIHFGTALLRLDSFWPVPALVDFSTIYSGAWAMRAGLSAYALSPELLAILQAQGLNQPPPGAFNPPFLYALFYPFTWLTYPQAAWAWVLLNLIFLGWITAELLRLGDIRGRRVGLLLYALVVTFGPTFLDLTLGQVSVLMLVALLLMGQRLENPSPASALIAGFAGMLAVTIKVYPLFWLGILPFLRRWSFLLASLLFLLLSFALPALWGPPGVLGEWAQFFQGRVLSASEIPGIDDQALTAWLDRIGRSETYGVPGISATTVEFIAWQLPWNFDPLALRLAGYALAGAIAAGVLLHIWRNRHSQPEAHFYLWVLVSLVVVPHIERYNHVLILPGMALLWGRGERARVVVCAVYFLVGLARLTHLWARILPAPWAPLITGSGLLGVLLLIAGLLRTHPRAGHASGGRR